MVGKSVQIACIFLISASALSGCNLPQPAVTVSTAPAITSVPQATPVPATGLPATNQPSDSGMQVQITNLTGGGTVAAKIDPTGRPLVPVQISVSGVAPLLVTMTANDFPVVDATGHTLEISNPDGALPFTGEIPWSPAQGGGEYTLVVTAMSNEKKFATATLHINVTGLAAFTKTPPPLDLVGAQARISDLIRKQFGVSLPKPSVYRFDSPQRPDLSRWIGSAYYQGTRYYIDLYDDTHYAWSNAPYSNPDHILSGDNWVLCRPSGSYRVLTIFIDYGNTGIDKNAALAKVPVVVDWLNGEYSAFAASQGLASPLLHVDAEAAYVSPPPVPGEFLTADQIQSLTGKNPSNYNFLMQIDLDATGTLVKRYFSNIIESGGGVALQGCGSGGKFGIINIWSSVSDAGSLEGALVMDYNHELSHLFGMMDNWPFTPGAPGPDGLRIDDWIPYPIFGWIDSDGDGIPEIIDPTPYGTNGPHP